MASPESKSKVASPKPAPYILAARNLTRRLEDGSIQTILRGDEFVPSEAELQSFGDQILTFEEYEALILGAEAEDRADTARREAKTAARRTEVGQAIEGQSAEAKSRAEKIARVRQRLEDRGARLKF